MPTSLPLGLLDVEILSGFGRFEAGAVLEFSDEADAHRFLRGLFDHPRSLETVRAALTRALPGRDLSRAPRGELMMLLAREVAAGRLRVAARPPRRVLDIPVGAASSAPPPAAPPARVTESTPADTQPAPAAAAPAAEEAADDPETNTDVQAQAETLKQAAQNGTPFCEECEKLRKAREAEAAQAEPAAAPQPEPAPPPPPADFPDHDTEAQAAVMTAAAEDGTPFCEECERLRKQREEELGPGAQPQSVSA